MFEIPFTYSGDPLPPFSALVYAGFSIFFTMLIICTITAMLGAIVAILWDTPIDDDDDYRGGRGTEGPSLEPWPPDWLVKQFEEDRVLV